MAGQKWRAKMKVTLYEIAQKAGVSISTVSRVLNNDKNKPASKATAEKVMQIAYETGYLIPPAPASTIANTKTVLCLLSNTAYDYSDYFYSQVLQGIEEEAGYYNLKLTQQLSSIELDSDSLYKNLKSNPYDGIILLGRLEKSKVEFIKSSTPNIVYAGLNYIDSELDQVICDSYKAINTMMDYLILCGHKRISFFGVITDETTPQVNEHRFLAYCDALVRHKIPLDMKLCKNIELKSEYAYNATLELISENTLPDAILCSTDSCAIAVISALRLHNIRVPEDISVVGHDGIDLSEFMEPKLTTIYMQKHELGKFAVKLLNDRMEKRHKIPVMVHLPYHLEIRASCLDRTKV